MNILAALYLVAFSILCLVGSQNMRTTLIVIFNLACALYLAQQVIL